MASLALGCTGTEGEDSLVDDPNKRGLAFAELPAAIRLSGRFEVTVRLNDDQGQRTGDSRTIVTIRASGQGNLRGTTSKRAIDGQVYFDDLVYDRWEPISFTLSASGFADATTRSPVPVRPVLRFVRLPPRQVPTGSPIGPIEIELVDGRGQAVQADQAIVLESIEGLSVAGGAERRVGAAGPAIYERVALAAAGSRTLTWRSPGLGDLIHGVTVHDGPQVESIWLPAARVGVPYRARVPGGGGEHRVLRGQLPRGLALEPGGEIHGVPTLAGHTSLEIFAVEGDRSMLWKSDLPVFSDAEPMAGALDALDTNGPFAVQSLDEVVPVASRRAQVTLRIFYPAEAASMPGRTFPVIVFHHGALPPDPARSTIFDRFDHLLRRWTSHGFVTCSIDAPDLVWSNGRLVNASLSNLNAMSENQRAAIAHLRGRNGDAAFALAGKLDLDRTIVAGHSRGGGAALITARTEASVVGGILIKPLDPMATVGGELSWYTSLPPKPFLLVIAGSDGDVPQPMVDYLYDRRAGPMVAPTLADSIHFFTCDASCPPEPGVLPGITREQDWAITNAYAVAFLKYAAGRDLSFAPYLFGKESLSTNLSPSGVWVRSDSGAAALVVDDFQNGTPGRNRLGLPTSETGMTWSGDEPALIGPTRTLPEGYDFYRVLYARSDNLARSNAHRLEWGQDGAIYASALGGLDVRRRGAFVFRARNDQGVLDPARLTLRFRDSLGYTAEISGAGHAGRAGIGPRFTDVFVPVREIRAAGLDLLQLDRVEIEFKGAGALLIDDLRFE